MTLSTAEIAEIIRRESAAGKSVDPEALAATLRRAIGTVTVDEYIDALPASVNGKVGEGYDEAAVRAWRSILEGDGGEALIGIITRVAKVAGEEPIFVNGAIALAAGDRIGDADFALLTDPVSEITTR